MELISFVIAAGETKRFERAGRYLEIIDATSALDVYLSDADGARGDTARGALSGLYMEGAYSAFELTSAAAQSVTLLLTEGRGGSRRQPGNVRVIDNAADKTDAGLQFIGSTTLAAAGAGVYSMVGIKAGARRVSLRRISVSSSIAGLMQWGHATGDPTTAYNATAGGAFNKRAGQAVSLAQRWTATSASSPVALGELPGRQIYSSINVPANTEAQLIGPGDAPIIIPAGAHFFVHGYVANRDVSAVLDYEELNA